jgi:hypothetical protein
LGVVLLINVFVIKKVAIGLPFLLRPGGKKKRPAVGSELSVEKNIVLPSAAGFQWEKKASCHWQRAFSGN